MLGLEDHFSGDLAIKNVSGDLNGVCEEKGSEKIEKSSCVKERVEENLKNKSSVGSCVKENSEGCMKKASVGNCRQICSNKIDNSKRSPLLENATADNKESSLYDKNSTDSPKKSCSTLVHESKEAAKKDFVERGKQLSVKLNKIREENTKLNLEYLKELDKKSALEEENLKRLEKHQNNLVEEYKVLERRQKELEEELKKLSKKNQEAESKVKEARSSQENGGNKKQVGKNYCYLCYRTLFF